MSETDRLGLSAPIVSALQERHTAFIVERLSSESGRADWIAGANELFSELLERRTKDIVSVDTLLPLLQRALKDEAVVRAAIPIVSEIRRRVLAAARKDDAKLGTFVPEAARTAIDKLLERSDLVPEEIIRAVAKEDAVEEVIAVVLYDGLREFNESVNPFFAEWGLPTLIRKFVPIGGGAVLKAMDSLRGEFDKRLEPESRKFIAAFARRAKGKVADLLIAKAGDPAFVALRKNVVRFVYEETLLSLTKNVDAAAEKELDAAITAIVLENIASDESWKRVRVELHRWLSDEGERTVRESLVAIGGVPEIDVTPLAELAWPVVQLGFASDAFRHFIDRLNADFYAAI